MHEYPSNDDRSESRRVQPPQSASSNAQPHQAGASVDDSAATRQRGGRSTSIALLSRVVYLLAFLLILQYVLPFLIERYQYAVTRGRQQAQYDVALGGLENLSLVSLSEAYQMVSQQVAPSVVHIDVRNEDEQPLPQDFAHLFGPQRRELRGQGSGVIVDAEGYVVTNYHVIHGAGQIQVTLSDGRVLPARIVGVDTLTDLAVLQVDGDRLVAAQWGDSDRLDVGGLVWAVGSPFGLQRTITFGILSAKHRSGMAGEVYQDFLQTDAAVNPGNSGGPLVDAQGRIVGINTAILGESYQGVSFAIPSSVARDVFQRLKDQGQVIRGWLGVQLNEVTDEDVVQYGLPNASGALVSMVINEPGVPSPARDAGVRPGDVVIRWNTKAITKPTDLIRQVAVTDVGSTATVIVLREGRKMTVQLTVAERPPDL